MWFRIIAFTLLSQSTVTVGLTAAQNSTVDLDEENSLTLFNIRHFIGASTKLSEADRDIGDHGFVGMLGSFEVKGHLAWQLFEMTNYNGKGVIVPPGKYDIRWVRSHLQSRQVASVRKVGLPDSLVLWPGVLYNGTYLTLTTAEENISQNASVSYTGAIHVTGPSSWELYTAMRFTGDKVVAAPGLFSADWVKHQLKAKPIISARRVAVNEAMCSVSSGRQRMAGRSGQTHEVMVGHKQDGSVWLRFGQGDMQHTWNYTQATVTSSGEVVQIISTEEQDAMKDFSFLHWEVGSDVRLRMSVDNSWHPSRIFVTYLGSNTTKVLKFEKSFTDLTDVIFGADKSRLACYGRVKDGSMLSNMCGREGLPNQGAVSNKLVITSLDISPHVARAYSKDNDLSRNVLTWSGSYYYVYAKLADCTAATSCFKRSEGMTYILDQTEAVSKNRSGMLNLGRMKHDVNACEAACKAEAKCVAYTLYQNNDNGLLGNCYGVGKGKIFTEAEKTGAVSGKAVPCESFIPQYMDDDMWTKNTTGCPCGFDSHRSDCACCHVGGCQCEHRYKYQCTLCGFGHRCGSPFQSPERHEYPFEYTNQQLSSTGHHYSVPGTCVTGCRMEVRGNGGAATKIAAYMADRNGRRVLSCIASDLDKTTDAVVETEGRSDNPKGVRIDKISLYAFGGSGELIQLWLKVNEHGCPQAVPDVRYQGCFAVEQATSGENRTRQPSFESTRMTRDACIRHCFNVGFSYATLKGGKACTCNMAAPNAGPALGCDKLCSGDSTQTCGGDSALSVYTTHEWGHSVVMAAVPGGCPKMGAIFVASAALLATGEQCSNITGVALPGGGLVNCELDWCAAGEVTSGGMFPAMPGSCGNRKLGEVFLRTLGADCLDMGGRPDFHPANWGLCKLDLCTSDKPRKTIYTLLSARSCPAFLRVAEVEINSTAEQCHALGGAPRQPAATGSGCQLDLCIQDKNATQDNMYTFPHRDELIAAGETQILSLPQMCITECQFEFTGASEGMSSAEVTLLGQNSTEAGLRCAGHATNSSRVDSLSFANKATGVIVSGIKVASTDQAFVFRKLKLRVNPNGCIDNEEVLVLYKKSAFGDRPEVIRGDVTDLSTLNIDKVSSFKIYGTAAWEMFERVDFEGRSVVFTAGEYNRMDGLPFDGSHVSSVRKVDPADPATDETRKQISNARGLVCFKWIPKSSAVFGLPPGGARSDLRPTVFYLGDFADDVQRCERACRREPQCAAFTQFSRRIIDEKLRDYRGLCYGRGFHDDIRIYQDDVMSGYVTSCAEEDTLTLYSARDFSGTNLTAFDDTVNISLSTRPYSAMVTGKDTWRVLTKSAGHLHTYTLAPGDYANLSATLEGRVVQVSKVHPETRLYAEQHNQIDLAPVAINQISKTITKIRTKLTEARHGKTVCNTTSEAEIFFILDASTSVTAPNYDIMLDFVANLTESFVLGANQVRVGVIVYSFSPHMDVVLGAHSQHAAIGAAIRQLRYYRGLTFTDRALQMLRENGLAEGMTRANVTKQAIIITDGRSTRESHTARQAKLCRDAGITLTAVGISDADVQELRTITGDASRVYKVTGFHGLTNITDSLEQTTCTVVEQAKPIYNETEHVSIIVEGNDTNYFVSEDWEFHRKPAALGMESGVIYNTQVFASSALVNNEAASARLNHHSGWLTTVGGVSARGAWIEIDLGNILPVHGIATQGHALLPSWVTKFKVANSLDGIQFVTFLELNTSVELVFLGNSDQQTTKYHCLHRLFGQPIMARVIRFSVIEWHNSIGMRLELYGFRDADDAQLMENLRMDVWTRNVTGCPCYFDPGRRDCACCEAGGCQCYKSTRHQCVKCGEPSMCGTPNLRNADSNIDGWTSAFSGCACDFDPLRSDCACCQNHGCQCGAVNRNQCVGCGHPESCGLKQHIFGPNPYCRPVSCPGTGNK